MNDSDSSLSAFRRRIDDVDRSVIAALGQRFTITRELWAYKQSHALAPTDPKREREMMSDRRAAARENDLDPDLVEELIKTIIAGVIKDYDRLDEESSNSAGTQKKGQR